MRRKEHTLQSQYFFLEVGVGFEQITISPGDASGVFNDFLSELLGNRGLAALAFGCSRGGNVHNHSVGLVSGHY
jgi:hypothetical protein